MKKHIITPLLIFFSMVMQAQTPPLVYDIENKLPESQFPIVRQFIDRFLLEGPKT